MMGLVFFDIMICASFYIFGRTYKRKFWPLEIMIWVILLGFLIIGNYAAFEQIKNENAQEIIEDYQNGKFDCRTTVVKVNNEIVSTEKEYYYKNKK